MPKCLDCGNTTRFWYTETCYKLGLYTADGVLEDVETDQYEPVTDGECEPCGSKNVEGKL
jgi:hypothetical protein